MKRSAAETRGSGSMPRMGCERSNAARVRREDGRGDRPVAANLRVVRGLLVLADSPPPGRRRPMPSSLKLPASGHTPAQEHEQHGLV